MSSDVEICNQALRHLGLGTISSLDENRREAKDCKLFFATARDAVLVDHAWNFAHKRRLLAGFAIPDDYLGKYSFAYIYPADCKKARKVLLSGGTAPQDFEVVRSPTGEKIILTNANPAVLVYTMTVTDPNWFDADFIEALALKLAAKLARPLTASAQAEQAMTTLYANAINAAKTTDAKEGEPEDVPDVPWIKARTIFGDDD